MTTEIIIPKTAANTNKTKFSQQKAHQRILLADQKFKTSIWTPLDTMLEISLNFTVARYAKVELS
jgi:hypothetical protein